MIVLLAGAVDTSIDVQIVDDTGLPVTGLVAATFPTVKYSKGTGADTTITLSDLSALTDAHSDGGVYERGEGVYRLDLTDAVSSAVAPAVKIRGEATNKRLIAPEIQVASATRGLTGTAVPAVAAEAAGGLFTRGTGAGQIAQQNNGMINAQLADVIHGGSSAQITLLKMEITNGTGDALTLNSTGGNGNGLMVIGNGTGAPISYNGTDFLAALTAAVLAQFSDHSGTAQAGAAGTITLASGASSTDDYYNGAVVSIYGGTGNGQSRRITDYVGSTRVATVDSSWVTTPDNTSLYFVIGRIA